MDQGFHQWMALYKDDLHKNQIKDGYQRVIHYIPNFHTVCSYFISFEH